MVRTVDAARRRTVATLLRPDDGWAMVDGHDVVREPAAVRAVATAIRQLFHNPAPDIADIWPLVHPALANSSRRPVACHSAGEPAFRVRPRRLPAG
jgi:hypothetical protein